VETTEAEAEVAAALLTTLLAWEGTDHVQTQPTAEGSAEQMILVPEQFCTVFQPPL
jgi:hypothetical protein